VMRLRAYLSIEPGGLLESRGERVAGRAGHPMLQR